MPTVRGLGGSHPDALASREALANAYASAGELDRAIRLYEATLTQSEEVLGDTHSHTLASRNNLAHARKAAETVQQPDTATPATAPSLQHPVDPFEQSE